MACRQNGKSQLESFVRESAETQAHARHATYSCVEHVRGGILLQDFGRNFANDPKVKIPWVRRDLCGARVMVMEWIDGLRCTDPAAIIASGLNIDEFIRCGVVSGLRQLLEVSTKLASIQAAGMAAI